MELGGVAVDERGVLAGDEGEFVAGAAGERDAHDVREGEALELFPIAAPEEAAVGEDAVYVEGEGFDLGEVEGHGDSVVQSV